MARLEHELEVIGRAGFVNYLLVVADIVRFARGRGSPVGPGRGAVAGSLAAWCLGITEIDPLRHGLPFERYIDPRLVSSPDFEDHSPGLDHAVPELMGRHREDGPEMRREVGYPPLPPGRHRPEFTPDDIDAHQRWVEDNTWSPEKDDGNGGIRPDWRTANHLSRADWSGRD